MPHNVYTVTVCVRVTAENAQNAKGKVREDLRTLRPSVTLIQADFFMHYDTEPPDQNLPCQSCPADFPEDQPRADHYWAAHGIVVRVAP